MHARGARFHFGDLLRREQFGATGRGRAQECSRERHGIRRQRAELPQARAATDAVTRFHRGCIHVPHVEAGACAGFGFAAQPAGVEQVALEVQGIHVLDFRVDAQPQYALAQRAHRHVRPDPGTLRIASAHAFNQPHQRRVELGHHHRRGGKRRAVQWTAALEDHHVQAGIAERLGNECAGNAGTHHHHVAAAVALQAQQPWQRDAGGFPGTVATVQVTTRSQCGHGVDDVRSTGRIL
jgi:hypothetical protein